MRLFNCEAVIAGRPAVGLVCGQPPVDRTAVKAVNRLRGPRVVLCQWHLTSTLSAHLNKIQDRS